MKLASLNFSPEIQATLPSWYDYVHHVLENTPKTRLDTTQYYLGSFDPNLYTDSFQSRERNPNTPMFDTLLVTELEPLKNATRLYDAVQSYAFLSANHMHRFLSSENAKDLNVYRTYTYGHLIPDLCVNRFSGTKYLVLVMPDDPKHLISFSRVIKRLISLCTRSGIDLKDPNIEVRGINIIVYNELQATELASAFGLSSVEDEDLNSIPVEFIPYTNVVHRSVNASVIWYFDQFPSMLTLKSLLHKIPSVCLANVSNLNIGNDDFLTQDMIVNLLAYEIPQTALRVI